MRNRYIHADAGKVYRQIIHDLLRYGNPHVINGEAMYSESIGTQVVLLSSSHNQINIPERKLGVPYMYTEALWDVSPTADISVLRKFNEHIDRFVANQPLGSRDSATWAYGPTMARELPRIVDHLRSNPLSRQAVVSLPRDSNVVGTPPCLVSVQFLLRGEPDRKSLHAVVTMRSNDIWLGFPLDIFQFGLIQQIVAAALEVPPGLYIHNVGSLHLYERDVLAARKIDENYDAKMLDDERESLMMPPLDVMAIKWIELGYLKDDLIRIANGVKPHVTNPFGLYLNVIYDAWFRKHGNKEST